MTSAAPESDVDEFSEEIKITSGETDLLGPLSIRAGTAVSRNGNHTSTVTIPVTNSPTSADVNAPISPLLLSPPTEGQGLKRGDSAIMKRAPRSDSSSVLKRSFSFLKRSFSKSKMSTYSGKSYAGSSGKLLLGFNPVCAVQISDVNGVPAVEKRFQIDKVFECEFAALFRQEVKQLQSINHHKLQMIFSVNLDTFSLFTGYMELGNLHEFIRVNSGGQLNRTQLPAASRIQWKLRHQILIDVLEAVAFLHSKNLVHGNLKSNNILLCLSSNRKMRAKVSDYCMNRLYQFVTSKKELIEQFSPYDSPEILDFSNESATKTDLICEASDAYAFGVVGWEVALMSSPEAAMRSVLHMVLSHSSSVYSSNHKDTFSSMLIHNQTTRSSAALDQKKPSPKSSVSSNHNLIIPDTLIPILFALLDKEPTQRPSFKVVLDELNLREKQISSFGNSAIFSSSTSSFSKEQYSSLSSIGPVSSVPQRTNTASENHTRESGIANAGYVTNILSGCFGCR